jgi:hypothetical protein
MDIRLENEIRVLKKLGLTDSMATIVASAKCGLPDVAGSVIALEKTNHQILMEETLSHMVPMETLPCLPEELRGTFIVVNESITEEEISE